MAEISERIEPGLAPGGIVFDVWLDGEHVRRRAVSEAEAHLARTFGDEDADWALEQAGPGGDYSVVAYDGDSGQLIGELRGSVRDSD